MIFEAAAPDPNFKLRPYQSRAKDAIEWCFGWKAAPDEAEIKPAKRAMVEMATGTGKTALFSALAKDAPGRVMVIAHRDELIEQAANKLREVTGDRVDIEKAGEAADQFSPSKIVVASVQTMNSQRGGRLRMERFDPARFGLLIIDECHHATADTYRRVIAHFEKNPDVRTLGVTATPDRADEESLGKLFGSLAFQYQMVDAIRDGYLCDVRSLTVALDTSFADINDVAGDFNQGELAEIMEEDAERHAVAKAIREQSEGRKTIVFGVRVKHAELLAEIFDAKEPGLARAISGATHKDLRKEIITDFRTGKIRYLCNVGVATEGFDVPDVGCVAVARPTKSRALYTQMVGRGTRPLFQCTLGETAEERKAAIAASSKPDCLVIDFTDNSTDHKLISCIDIMSEDYEDEVIAKAKELAGDNVVNPVDVLAAAEEELRRIRAKKAAEEADKALLKKRAAVEINGIEYEVYSVDPFDMLNIPRPRSRPWDLVTGPTAKQGQALAGRGINPVGLTRHEAAKLLDVVINTPTLKQKKLLKSKGMWVEGMTAQEAKIACGVLANNNWQRPYGWTNVKAKAMANG